MIFVRSHEKLACLARLLILASIVISQRLHTGLIVVTVDDNDS